MVLSSMRFLLQKLAPLLTFLICSGIAWADSVSIHILCRDGGREIEATVADPWKLKKYCDSALGRRGLDVSLRLQPSTPVLAIVEALRVLPDLESLTLYGNTCKLADSLFMQLSMRKLQFLRFDCLTGDSVPFMVRALPALTGLSVNTRSSSFPCSFLKLLPRLTYIGLGTKVMSESCDCEPSRRIVICAEDSVDESLDANSLFIKSGALTRMADVSQLYPKQDASDTIPARAGTRRYLLQVDSLNRAIIPNVSGVLDRLIATFYAQVRAGKAILANDGPETRSSFLRLVEDEHEMLVEVSYDRIVLSKRTEWDSAKKYVFKGMQAGQLMKLIADGCL